MRRNARLKWLAGITIVLSLIFGLVLCLKIPALPLSGQEFCGSCHVMDFQVDTYRHSVHMVNANCADCHVPHHLVRGAFNKAWTGTVDLVGVLRNVDPYEIHSSDTAKVIIQENCVRCHQGWLRQVGDTMDNGGKYCFECHRNTPHAIKPNMTADDMGFIDRGQGKTKSRELAFQSVRHEAKGGV